ncbi:hypothetical protein IH970_11370 [candidate division KSB1 bacterium]|nr:hypothetical protein [candidate division KSB1 bacterium]
MSGYVIHPAPDLSPSDYQRAIVLGPSEVGYKQSLNSLLKDSGFSQIHQIDVTKSFLTICRSIISARVRRKEELRLAEGEVEFEEEQTKKRGIAEGIEAGLLVRSFIVGAKPE